MMMMMMRYCGIAERDGAASGDDGLWWDEQRHL